MQLHQRETHNSTRDVKNLESRNVPNLYFREKSVIRHESDWDTQFLVQVARTLLFLSYTRTVSRIS